MRILKNISLVILLLIASSCANKNYPIAKENKLERTQDEIRNIWFSSYLDSDNNKHHPSNVEVVIKRSDWFKR
ncbi:hypothetical protein N9X24_01205 [Rickettsiales bacterium]|nr:hypothetical protein [Rickettsiales bacterium]